MKGVVVLINSELMKKMETYNNETSSKILAFSNYESNVRAFPEFAFVDMISNNEYRNGLQIFRGGSSEIIDKKWIFDNENSNIKVCYNNISVEEPFYSQKNVKRMFRKLEKDDSFVLRVDYQQYTNRWDSAGIFLDIKKSEYEEISDHAVSFVNFCGGMICAILEGEHTFRNISETGEHYPFWMKIDVKNDNVLLSYAEKAGEWKEFVEYNLKNRRNGEEYVLGVYFYLSERQYYKWLFNNFINYRFDINDQSVLKYTGIMRDSKHYSINPILRISDDSYSVLKECGIDLIEYIHANIDFGKYVEFWLNEKYIPGLEAYRARDYFHEGLVYGYDKTRKILNMCFFVKGKPVVLEVDEMNLILAYAKSDKNRADRIFIISFYPSNKPYEFDINGVVSQLEDYIHGINPTRQHMRFIGKEDGVFGINCYDEILYNSIALEAFLSDIRIPYVIKEHKQCMYERVKYLNDMGYFEKHEGEALIKQVKEVSDRANILLNLVIMRTLRKNKDLDYRIKEMIVLIKEKEKLTYQKIVDCLSKKEIQ